MDDQAAECSGDDNFWRLSFANEALRRVPPYLKVENRRCGIFSQRLNWSELVNFLSKLRNKLLTAPNYHDKSLKYLVSEMNGIHDGNQELICSGYGDEFSCEVRRFKKTDTLFILGSGPSINDLSEKDFDIIRNHDSIGFNFWMVHDFVPSMYCFQHTEYANGSIYSILNDKKKQYKDVPFFVRGSLIRKNLSFCAEMHQKYMDDLSCYFLNELPVHSKVAIDVIELIKFFQRLGHFEFGRISKFQPKWRGTLGLLISLAYQMGYRKIILCGIDMKDSRYFYDHHSYDKIRMLYKLPAAGDHNILTMEDKSHSNSTVSNYVENLARFIRKENNVEMFISTSESVLSSVLPIWKR